MKIDLLIVDDRPENLLAMGSVLESPELNIVTASSGNEALTLMLRHDFALVLLDVQMPGMDGFETAALMRRRQKTQNVPIIFVTALSKEDRHIFKGYDSGAVDYLFKPVNPQILKSKVGIFLQLHRQQRILAQKVKELEEISAKLEEANDRLERLSFIDCLTSIPNRRRFNEVLDQEWRRAAREGKPLSLLMVDIDYFKDYNDLYGHLAGDECLRAVAGGLAGIARRPGDFVGRYGGEEFAAILYDTDASGARLVAESMRAGVEQLLLPHNSSQIANHVTVSLGLAMAKPPLGAPHKLIETADESLYEAKEAGRNRIGPVQELR